MKYRVNVTLWKTEDEQEARRVAEALGWAENKVQIRKQVEGFDHSMWYIVERYDCSTCPNILRRDGLENEATESSVSL